MLEPTPKMMINHFLPFLPWGCHRVFSCEFPQFISCHHFEYHIQKRTNSKRRRPHVLESFHRTRQAQFFTEDPAAWPVGGCVFVLFTVCLKGNQRGLLYELLCPGKPKGKPLILESPHVEPDLGCLKMVFQWLPLNNNLVPSQEDTPAGGSRRSYFPGQFLSETADSASAFDGFQAVGKKALLAPAKAHSSEADRFRRRAWTARRLRVSSWCSSSVGRSIHQPETWRTA